MNEREIREAFRLMTEGTDPAGAADAVRKAVATESGAEHKSGKEKVPMKRQIRWTAVLAAAALVVVLTAAVTAAPMLRNYLNTLSLQEDSVTRLTEVPEGWVGIYTLDDLDAVRDDLSGFYILMEDLAFSPADFEEGGRFEGGWEPIGTCTAPFTGAFNGNGHTIDRLKVEVSDNTSPVVVSDLQARSLGAGLFGFAEAVGNYRFVTRVEWVLTGEEDANGNPVFAEQKVTKKIYDDPRDDNRWGRGGLIKNLRLTNASIRLLYQPVEFFDLRSYAGAVKLAAEVFYYRTLAYAGTVAGYADYVYGCAAENCAVEVICTGDGLAAEWAAFYDVPVEELWTATPKLFMGGVTGCSYLIDSCAADTRIVTQASAGYPAPASCVGGLSGRMSACVTSCFNGSIEGDLGDCGVGELLIHDVPRVLPSAVMDELVIRLVYTDDLSMSDGEFTGKVYMDNYEELTEKLRRDGVTADTLHSYFEALGFDQDTPNGRWYANKLRSFYSPAEPGKETIDFGTVQDLYADDITGQTFYVLDPTIKPREYQELSHLIQAAFPGTTFMDFCRENNVKYGSYYVYDLRTDPDCTFDGFDFDAVWIRDEASGLPVLRIFR